MFIIILCGTLNFYSNSNSNSNNTIKNYLFDANHSLIVFIICVIGFLIDCNYKLLFPQFWLPRNVNARSKWGLTFAGQLRELEKVSVKLTKWQKNETRFWDEGVDDKKNRSNGNGPSCAVFALANKHYHIVQWLESQGAIRHKELIKPDQQDFIGARNEIDRDRPKKYNGWIENYGIYAINQDEVKRSRFDLVFILVSLFLNFIHL